MTKEDRTLPSRGGWTLLSFTVVILLGPLWLAKHRLQCTPLPKPADAPAAQFSESRALRHVHDLVDGIGDRQVGHAACITPWRVHLLCSTTTKLPEFCTNCVCVCVHRSAAQAFNSLRVTC